MQHVLQYVQTIPHSLHNEIRTFIYSDVIWINVNRFAAKVFSRENVISPVIADADDFFIMDTKLCTNILLII